jgi:predicted enzyme related to lactoylglutathione lyase
MASHLGLVTIFAEDVARTVTFYTELLGFEAIPMFSEPTGNFVFLHSKNGNANIAIQNVATRKATQLGIPEENGGLMLGFVVEDAEAAYQEWLSKDIELRTELSDMGFGRTFGANDPSGTYIQIYDIIPQAQAVLKRIEAN